MRHPNHTCTEGDGALSSWARSVVGETIATLSITTVGALLAHRLAAATASLSRAATQTLR